MVAHLLKTGLIAGFALAAASQTSLALDADDLGQKLAKFYELSGAKLTYDGATLNGSDVTLSNTKINYSGELPFDFGDTVFQGVREDGSGNYMIDVVTNGEVSFGSSEFSGRIEDMKTENMFIPAVPSMDSIDTMVWYERATTGAVTMSVEGRQAVGIASVDLRNGKSDDRIDASFRANGLEIDLGVIDDPQARQVVAGMGYQNLSGDAVVNGYWDTTNGEMNLSELALTLNDVGRLEFAFSFSGYTIDFMKGLQELQQNMAGEEQNPSAQQAMGMAALGMMQQLSFNTLSLRFDDASVTNKILDMVASQQGMTRTQMVQGLQAMVPFALSQLRNPDFQKSVTEAVSLYLADPKNIEISAAPTDPVPFATVFGSAMAAPQSLPDVLGVTVTANQ